MASTPKESFFSRESARRMSESAATSAASAGLGMRAKGKELAGHVSKATSRPTGAQPCRVGFVGIARDRDLVVWAHDAGDRGPHAHVLSARYAALGRKLASRKDEPGWDEVADAGSAAQPAAKGGGAMRAISLPVCDVQGTTSYIVAFGAAYPVAKAQLLCERLALMLGALVDAELQAGEGRMTPAGAKDLRAMLEREVASANDFSAAESVTHKVEEVRAIMEHNVEMLLDRGDKLEKLEHQSESLKSAAGMFRKQSRKLKRWHLMNKVKWGVAVGTLVTASIAIPIALLVAI